MKLPSCHRGLHHTLFSPTPKILHRSSFELLMKLSKWICGTGSIEDEYCTSRYSAKAFSQVRKLLVANREVIGKRDKERFKKLCAGGGGLRKDFDSQGVQKDLCRCEPNRSRRKRNGGMPLSLYGAPGPSPFRAVCFLGRF